MKKIIVIGSPGAGKSVFSQKLKDITKLPVYHLDMLYHKKDGTHISKEELEEKLKSIFNEEKWIIDGNYQRTLEMRLKECDTVFLLDFSTDVCIAGAESRIGMKRDDLPWIEEKLDEEFKKCIVDFAKEKLPQIYNLLDKYKADTDIIVFKTREEADNYIKENLIKNKSDFIKIGEGSTSKAYMYDKNYVLLVGKRDDSFEIYKKLKKNLDLLEGKINSIRIPSKSKVIKPCEDYPLGAMTYLYVEGNELKKRIHTCTKEQKRNIGKKLAEFVFEMQNINNNLDKNKEIEINNNKFKNSIELIKPYLSNEEKIKLERIAINYNDFMKNSIFCMTHGDLQEENLIVDKYNNLIGIIDFGNMEYYVPEIEFDSMMNYDLSIFEAMLENFKGKTEINNIRLVGLVRRIRFFKHIVNKNYKSILKEVEEIKILLSKYKL